MEEGAPPAEILKFIPRENAVDATAWPTELVEFVSLPPISQFLAQLGVDSLNAFAENVDLDEGHDTTLQQLLAALPDKPKKVRLQRNRAQKALADLLLRLQLFEEFDSEEMGSLSRVDCTRIPVEKMQARVGGAIRDQFDAIDTDKDGRISFAELFLAAEVSAGEGVPPTQTKEAQAETSVARSPAGTLKQKPPSPSASGSSAESSPQMSRYPEYWGAVPDGEAPDTVQISGQQQPDLWAEMQRRVSESLPDFEVEAIEVVRNKLLWQKYEAFKTTHARNKQHQSFQCGCYTCTDPHQHESWDEHKHEMRLFHYAKPEVVEKIVRGSSGFGSRLEDGEYGVGAYFAHHAIYPVAFGNFWLHGDFTHERGAVITINGREVTTGAERISLLVGRVCLGHCKDFGPRCRSSKGDKYAFEEDVPEGLQADWGVAKGAAAVGRAVAEGQMPRVFRRGPPHPEAGDGHLYDSVSGTEARLDWTQNPRLRNEGDRFGRQFVTFEPSQAYPDCVVQLRRRSEVTAAFRRAEEQEARGKQDESMRPGTQLWIAGKGDGVYQRFKQGTGSFWGGSYNQHHILLKQYAGESDVAQQVSLGDPSVQWHVTAAPMERTELVPERVKTTLFVTGHDTVKDGRKSYVAWIVFVSSPVLHGSAEVCTCIRKRWSTCEKFWADVDSKVNIHLSDRQKLAARFPTQAFSHNFDVAELKSRQHQLDNFFNQVATWVERLCLDHINLFDRACEADPKNVVLTFFTSDYSVADSTRLGKVYTSEFQRREKARKLFPEPEPEA